MIWVYVTIIVVLITAVLLAVLLQPKSKVFISTVKVTTTDPMYIYPTEKGQVVESIKYAHTGEEWVDDKEPVKGYRFPTWTTSGSIGLTTKLIENVLHTAVTGVNEETLVLYQSLNATAHTLDQVWTEQPIFTGATVIDHTVRYDEDDQVQLAILTNTNLGWYTFNGTSIVSGTNLLVSYLGIKSVGDYVIGFDSTTAYVYYQQALTAEIEFVNLSLLDINSDGTTTILALHDSNESFRFIELVNGLESTSSSLTLNASTDPTSAIAINTSGPQSYSLVYQQGTDIFRTVGTNLSFDAPTLIASNALSGSAHLANRTLTSGGNVTIFISDDIQMSYALLQADSKRVNPAVSNPCISFKAFIDAEDRVHHHSITVTKDGPRHRHYATAENASYELLCVVNNIYKT